MDADRDRERETEREMESVKQQKSLLGSLRYSNQDYYANPLSHFIVQYAIHHRLNRRLCSNRLTPSHCASAVKPSSIDCVEVELVRSFTRLLARLLVAHTHSLTFSIASFSRALITLNCTCNSQAQAQYNIQQPSCS